MKAKELRKVFGAQLSELYRIDQKLSYLLYMKDNRLTVQSLSFWQIGMLVEEFDYLKKDQEGHILPVFRIR